MPQAERNLEKLQRWFQSVVTHPGGVAAGEVDLLTCASSRQTPAERLAVYAHAYWARLLECLREEFPVLRTAVGEDAFDGFAVGYLERHPSQSYTLGKLSEQFAAYLTETLSTADEHDDFGRFVVELAQFERAINEVFDLDGGETLGFLTAEELESVPSERRGELRLTPLPTFRLLAFEYDVNGFFTAAKADAANVPAPERRRTFTALSRRGYIVRRHALTRQQHALLAALVAGRTLAEAVERLLASPDAAAAGFDATQLADWFATWARAGFFRRLES